MNEEKPRRVEPIENRPVREQAIIYLVNRLCVSFKAYRGAATKAEAEGAWADFERACSQLNIIGIPIDVNHPVTGPDR